MGRPLNKKYFGNRNIGTGGYPSSDDGIGGEGIASINISNQGSFRGNNSGGILDGLALPSPTIPGGVQATWTIVYEVESVTTGAGKAGLVVGDTYTYAGTGSAVFTVASVAGANATFTVTDRGTGISSLPADTTTVSMTRVSGSGAATFTVDINFRIKSLTINEKGSGYTGSETFTVTIHSGATGTAPAGTIVLTTDSGNISTADNQENAILITAYVPVANGGSSAVSGDIVKQASSRRYKVKTAQGTGVVKLVATAPAAGEARITATDSAGGTYYVTKLTAHRALVTRGTGTQFATGASVPWTFGTATLNSTVKIQNA